MTRIPLLEKDRAGFVSLSCLFRVAVDKNKTPHQQVIIKAVIIQQLQSLATELNRTPTGADIIAAYRKGKCVSISAVRKAFGTIRQAQIAARLPLKKEQVFTQQQLIAQLRDLSRALRRPLTRKDVRRAARAGTCANLVTFARAFGSPINAFRAAGVQSKRRFTRADLIEQYRALAKQLGRVPRWSDVNRAWKRGQCANYSQFVAVGGGLGKIRRDAGLPDNTKQRYSREELLEQLRRLAKELGRPPTVPDVDAACKTGKSASQHTLAARFGKFNSALREAGLEVLRPRRYTRQQLLKMLRQLAQKLGHRPSHREMLVACNRRECPSVTVYISQFGTKERAFEAAGLSNFPVKPLVKTPKKYTRAQMEEQLRRLASKLGRRPTTVDMAAASRRGECASPFAIQSYFGSLSAALKSAGFVFESRYLTPERLIEQLRGLTRTLRRMPTARDIFEAKGRCSTNKTFKRLFGSLMEARTAANLDELLKAMGVEAKHPRQRMKYSREALITHLRSLAMSLGRTPSTADIAKACTEEGGPGVALYAKEFGGIPAARKAAKLDKVLRKV
jgi:hypothetical protein